MRAVTKCETCSYKHTCPFKKLDYVGVQTGKRAVCAVKGEAVLTPGEECPLASSSPLTHIIKTGLAVKLDGRYISIWLSPAGDLVFYANIPQFRSIQDLGLFASSKGFIVKSSTNMSKETWALIANVSVTFIREVLEQLQKLGDLLMRPFMAKHAWKRIESHAQDNQRTVIHQELNN